METPRIPVQKTIGGISFEDPYQWLQPECEEALAWQKHHVGEAVEAARAVPFFTDLVGRIAEVRQPVAALLGASSRKVGGRWFTLGMNGEGTAQAIRVGEEPGTGDAVVDAAAIAVAEGETRPLSILWFSPSMDGRYVAFTMLTGGDMTGLIRVADVASGALLDTRVEVLAFNMPIPGWLPDSSGFYVQGRAPDGHHEMRFVPVGTDAAEPVVTTFSFEDVPTVLPGLVPQVSPGGSRVMAVTVPHEHLAVMIGDVEVGTWRRFAPNGFHGEIYGDWRDEDTYLAIVTDDPRGRLVAIPAATSTDVSTWEELLPAGDLVLRALQIVEGRVVLVALDDVSLHLRILELDGTLVATPALPPFGGSSGLVGPGRIKPRAEAFVFSANTFTSTDATYRLHTQDGRLEALAEPSVQLDGIGVQRRFATSQDGTHVPYFVVAREDLDLTKPNPTLVYAYGGFNLAVLPTFLAHATPFVEAGGVYVQASLRGGSEYGRGWHDAGRLHSKQNTFDDLRAVVEDLIAAGLSEPSKLAFHGASNGGMLAGVAITQLHDLFRVVVPQVPLFDIMEPVADIPEAEAIRSYYLGEYGDPANPADAKVLYSYSPYHNIREGTAYPAVFQVFGEKDLGSPPFHGRKFTAALQHASTGGPIHMRVWEDVGHGALDPRTSAEQYAEWVAFVMHELGMNYPTLP